MTSCNILTFDFTFYGFLRLRHRGIILWKTAVKFIQNKRI